MTPQRSRAALRLSLSAATLAGAMFTGAAAQTPVAGHYPPGQSGIRGAASPPAGWTVTNFNRLFSNLEVRDANGDGAGDVGEVRFANITMVSWTTNWRVLGMQYGALAGFPFATGNLNPSTADAGSTGFGPGDILFTPVSLYARGPSHDHQFQFTLWSPSGHFEPGSPDNRGTGFWALVYSIGGTWYPGGRRDDWSVAAVARFEQNFEQAHTGITPGDDVVVDWGVGKTMTAGGRPLELGASGFGVWQLTDQSGGSPGPPPGPYRYFGIGPEGSWAVSEHWTLRLRLHAEFLVRNSIEGNAGWFIVNYAR